MERNREVRRGMGAINGGGGLLRRRQRNGSYRDSPEDDGVTEKHETGRLRDRGSKKDRDLDRSGRSKRRRGDRIMLASNREEGEDTSDDTDEDDDVDDEEEASIPVRLPPQPPLNHAPPPPSLSQSHHRKSFPITAKAGRTPAVWKPGDEMIGVSVPRKARTSSVKRCQDFSSCGGGSEQIHRQASTSPATPSPSSASQISPSRSSSCAPARKKTKQIGGTKHRPPKISKPSSVSEDMEMVEVAEVLFELTRQFQPQETNRSNSKDTNGATNEIKPKDSGSLQSAGPNATVLLPSNPNSSTTQMPSMVPRMKRPASIKSEEEETPANPPSLPASSAAKTTESEQPAKAETSSPRLEKNTRSPMKENGSGQGSLGDSQVATVPTPISIQQELMKPKPNSMADSDSDRRDRAEAKQEANCFAKEIPPSDLDVNVNEGSETEAVTVAENTPKVKLSIDLMVPPPGRLSLGMEGLSDYASTDHKAEDTKIQLVAIKGEIVNGEEGEMEKSTKREAEEVVSEVKKAGNSVPDDFDLKQHIAEEREIDLQLAFEKHSKDGLECSKQQARKQPLEVAKMEHGADNSEQLASLPLPTTIAGWPGSFPSLGYMGQVPPLQPVLPVEGSAGSAKPVQRPNFLSAQLRPKRCATHCYIAHKINYHQQLSRMNPFWPATAGPPQLYGPKLCDPNVAKHYNLSAAPPLEASVLGNPLQGNITARNLSLVQEKAGQLSTGYTSHVMKEKPQVGNPFTEAAQRKQLVLQQAPQSGSAANMLHSGPTFVIPINQQQAAAAPAQSGTSKLVLGTGNAMTSSSSASSVVGSSGASGLATAMTFNYPVMPTNEAQYIAMLQNSGYPFPIPAIGPPPTYRGGIAAQATPFFNGHFYSSQMLHPQLHQQQQASAHQPLSQQPSGPSHSHTQPGNQNTSTSSGSSSSHKPQHKSQRAAVDAHTGTPASSIQGFPASKQQRHHLPTQCEMGSDSPPTANSKVPQAQKNLYGHSLAMAIHPQNFALISPAAAAALGSGGVNHNEKQNQPLQQHQPIKVDLTTSQAFPLTFASSADGATGLPPGIDLSSTAQNQAVLQGFPNAVKHGDHITIAVAQASQHRKSQHQNAEDGKSTGDSMNTSTAEEDRKMMATSKHVGNVPQNSISFSRLNNDAPVSATVGDSAIESSSRTLNLIQAPSSNGSRSSNRPASAAPATTSSATASAPLSTQLQQQQQQQQQQQLIQLQKLHQQHQQLQLQNQFGNRNTKSSTPTTSTTLYTDRLPTGSTMSKFPQALAGFPQAFMQGTGSMQSPQWKTSTRASAPTAAAALPPPVPSSSKNQISQPQGRTLQQPIVMPGHQTQISFSTSSSKSSGPAGHPSAGGSNPSVPSPAVGSLQSSVSKNAGGSPRASSGAKSSATQQQQQQQQQQPPSSKNLPSSSLNVKSTPLSNLSTPSILGHSPITKQQQPQPQELQKQPVSQAQFFFSTAYLQAQPSQSNHSNGSLAAAGYYHQKRRSEDSEQSSQQQAQASSASGSTRMLSLCPTSMALAAAPSKAIEPVKATSGAAAAGSDMKTVSGMLQHPAQFASHPFMTGAATAAFPYIQTMPPILVKPSGEQKPAAGNDNLHVSWQPEKR